MITFSEKSWHGRVIQYMTPFYPHTTKNICQLIRRLLFALVLTLPLFTVAAIFVSVFIIGGAGFTIYHDIMWLLGHKNVYTEFYNPSCVFVFNWLFVAIVAFIGFLMSYTYVAEKFDLISSKPPGVFGTYYKSLKDKVCILVKYE